MASREHSFSRRALLGAAVAVPLLPLTEPAQGFGGGASPPAVPLQPMHPPPAPPCVQEGEAWSEIFRAYRRAEAVMERFQEASSAKAYGPGRRPFDEQEALDARFGEIVDVADGAMLALLRAPAPDLEALAVKIALISDHLVWELEGGEDCLAWLEADARRLAAAQGK